MKKFVIILLIILSVFIAGCSRKDNEKNAINLLINGDIENYSVITNLNDIASEELSFTQDNEEISLQAYKLSNIIKKINLLNENNWIMLCGSDDICAKIDYANAKLCYITVQDKKLNIKAPQMPKSAGIKDISEITVISKDSDNYGIKLVNENNTTYLSYGNAKLSLYKELSENRMNGNVAYKYGIKAQTKLSSITGDTENIVYLENFHITKSENDSGKLFWENSKLCYQKGNDKYSNIFGIISGTETLTYDSYYEIQNSIDNNEKVMFILPDGFSYEQVQYYKDELTFFNSNYIRACTVNPAISNVSLATLITGKSPFETGITERCIKKPNGEDIFDYALSKGKSVSYTEGIGNLLKTNVNQIYSIPDTNGYTDANVFRNAQQEIAKNKDFIFVHFHGIDDINHEYSPLSNQAKEKIIETENYIKLLTENFHGKIIIVPDHGHIGYVDENNQPKGHHGKFETKDMYVPYYVIQKG